MNTKPLAVLVAAAALSACASAPPPRAAVPPPEPVNLTRVYFYPQNGQSEAQQDRDRYDCYVWSVRQTGFDPARRIGQGETRAVVVPARSRNDTIGAVAARPGDVGEGALIGAVAGGMVGAVAADANAGAARTTSSRVDARALGRYEREAAEYRRAMSACLEGRGYSVR